MFVAIWFSRFIGKYERDRNTYVVVGSTASYRSLFFGSNGGRSEKLGVQTVILRRVEFRKDWKLSYFLFERTTW